MKLYFKQRISFFSSYDIYDEAGNTVYTVESQPSWSKIMHVRGANGGYLATVKQVFWAWRPRFEIYIGPDYAGTIRRTGPVFTHPHYDIDFRGWQAEGNFMEYDYTITDDSRCVAVVSKEPFHLTDRYVIEVADPDDALSVLLLVLAIDAEKASRG